MVKMVFENVNLHLCLSFMKEKLTQFGRIR